MSTNQTTGPKASVKAEAIKKLKQVLSDPRMAAAINDKPGHVDPKQSR